MKRSSIKCSRGAQDTVRCTDHCLVHADVAQARKQAVLPSVQFPLQTEHKPPPLLTFTFVQSVLISFVDLVPSVVTIQHNFTVIRKEDFVPGLEVRPV